MTLNHTQIHGTSLDRLHPRDNIHSYKFIQILAVWNCWRVELFDPSNRANRNVWEAQKVGICHPRLTYFLHKAKHSRNSQKLYAPVTRQGIFLVVQYFFCDEIIWVVRSSPVPMSLHHHLIIPQDNFCHNVKDLQCNWSLTKGQQPTRPKPTVLIEIMGYYLCHPYFMLRTIKITKKGLLSCLVLLYNTIQRLGRIWLKNCRQERSDAQRVRERERGEFCKFCNVAPGQLGTETLGKFTLGQS